MKSITSMYNGNGGGKESFAQGGVKDKNSIVNIKTSL